MLRASTLTKGLTLDNDASSMEQDVIITYDISNDCGLDAAAIMDENENTVMQGLIAATETIAIQILDASFSGVAHLNTDEHPVVIGRVLNMPANCAEGMTCLLVISTIPVMMEGDSDDQYQAVRKAIMNGMQTSFTDGSFFNAIPEDTVVCPGTAPSATTIMSHLTLN
eukprot:CAMPEP_0201629356 /NCGR_PEP_ID=MMETSP0493-20130528/4057_1 /ASSEMBLY_ACC=CAM_ASM_000838 /TAXON_ID=420259 /ORGANISM="Thalassiosira gravida, Strain GMp14c1" /LENGTH=167 /DNA_ID=CAMNT_0048100345 /DNA_START=61 /DNA_END=564 /DNA_ORIENTATION=-